MNPIICALDTCRLDRAITLSNLLRGKVGMIKLGLEFFFSHGLHGVREISKCNVPIFLDVKLHDIPNTVSKAISVIRDLDIAMLTVHVTGGEKMLRKAMHALIEKEIKLIGVTVLTSMDDEDLNRCGINRKVKEHVALLAKCAKESGLDGVVCSSLEIEKVREECGKDFKIITPGIRINSENNDDQKRTATPQEALLLGANYIVIGRPITGSDNPVEKVKSIMDMLNL
ncbi:MAG: orotidine-5'-phosphate decarboxylase [Wolbachia endosymbiont of Fragariocoptes setiger]|nr:orotidine-5'-phosphate decarboxylase [Wolbachia endosymbiont of Fragariocoptes setiger]